MRYHIIRIRYYGENAHSEVCDITVDNIEEYRKNLGGNVGFVYDIVD